MILTFITLAALGVATISVLLPFLALICHFPLNLIWPDLVACLLLSTALYFFRKYVREKKVSAIYLCHIFLCATMVSSSIVWVGIPFLDLFMLISANLFGFLFIVFSLLLAGTALFRK